MIVLGLDTTGGHCTATLMDNNQIRAEYSENIGRGHAERLAPMVQDLLISAYLHAKDLDRIGVCTGPGSFTGSRVALSFAKGLALPHDISVIGLSALEALAHNSLGNPVLSVMDVRRGDICWAIYENGIESHAPITEPIAVAKDNLASHHFKTVVGDGAHFVSDIPTTHTVVSGKAICQLAQIHSPTTHPAVPLYSRPADAKLPGGKSLS